MKNIGWISEVKESGNQEGTFKYVIAGDNASSVDKCIYALQGFNTVVTTASGTYFKSIVSFSYCAAKTSETELLEYYSSIQVIDE